jgi:hypothetical protein
MSQPPYPPPYLPPPPPSRPPRWGRFIAWTGAAAVAAFAIGGGLAVLMDDDASPTASPTACKAALTENYQEAMAAGPDAPTAAAPPSCLGLDEATLTRITGEVISEYLESPEAEEDMERLLESAAAQP